MKRIICIFLLLFINIAVAATQHNAIPLTREHVCALDGMILMDHAGPKAQIIWKDGKRTFYCDVREAFTVWLDPIQQKRINQFFIQNFDSLEWGAHTGNWINAKAAYFVIDSRKRGAMGLSYVPFSKKSEAETFQKKEGGKVVTFDEMTATVLEESQMLMRRHPEKYMPQGMNHHE